MFFLYIIQSILDGSFYVGVTDDPPWRLFRHNDGWSRSTKAKRPWKIVYLEAFSTKTETLRREREIKAKKSRRYIEGLIQNAGAPCSDAESLSSISPL